MPNINILLEENSTNHYKLLTLVGNNVAKIERIVEYLKNKGLKVIP